MSQSLNGGLVVAAVRQKGVKGQIRAHDADSFSTGNPLAATAIREQI
jgi:hypothetical protein